MDIKKILIILLLLIFITSCATTPFKDFGLGDKFGTKKAKQGVGINIEFKDGQPNTKQISETTGFKVTPVLKNYIPEEILTYVCIRDTWVSSKGGIQDWDCQGITLEPAAISDEGTIREPSTEEARFERYNFNDIAKESTEPKTDIIAKAVYSIDTVLSPRFIVPKGSSRFSVSGNDLSKSAKYLPVTVSSIEVLSTAYEEDYEADLELTIEIKNQGGGSIVDLDEKEIDTISIDIDSYILEDLSCQSKESIKLVDEKAEVFCTAKITGEGFPTTTGLDIILTYDYKIENKIEGIKIIE